MKLVLALIILVAGIAGGAGIGMVLKPAPAPDDTGAPAASDGESADGNGAKSDQAETASLEDAADQAATYDPARPPDYVKLGRQIVVPVVEGGETKALMLFEIALDVETGQSEAVYALEPRLRDAFLRNLLEMSYTGAFLGTFTDDRVLEELRAKLLLSARHYLGDMARDVLILDIVRQEYQN